MGSCKVCRVLEKYDIEYYDERLVEQWTAPKAERKGYRQLADWLNKNVLRQEMDRVGVSTLGGEVESKYERLREESATAVQLRQQLASEGIRIEELEDDFVSYGVIRRHLKECLEAERSDPEVSDWEETAIQITTDRAEEKIADATRSLLNKGEVVASDDVSLHVSTEIECENCQTRIPLARAVRRGYVCSCGNKETNNE